MDNTCQTCGNDLEYGDCANLAVYCTRCGYGDGIDGEYIEEAYNDVWVRAWDRYQEKHQ